MKTKVLILTMLLMAATAFNQTSRRSTNNHTATVKKVENRKSPNHSGYKSTQVNTISKPGKYSRTSTFESKRTRNNNTVNENKKEEYALHTRTSKNNHVYRRTTSDNSNKSVNNYVHAEYPSARKYRGTRNIKYHYTKKPYHIKYRAVHYPYRVPVQYNIYWDHIRIQYCRIYPALTIYRYPTGYRIRTISAYDAMYYKGEIMSVYGKVSEVFYSPEHDEYILYIGPYYPYHDFTVVVPGWIARQYSERPALYFENQHVVSTGLITTFDSKPEIVVKESSQLKLY